MNREETIALFLENLERPGAWNEWAEKMLREKEELEKEGLLNITTQWNSDSGEFVQQTHNESSREWAKKARVDFSNSNFMDNFRRFLDKNYEKELDFSGFIFPSIATFKNVIFCKLSLFLGTKFHGAANFKNAQFQKIVSFNNSEFKGEANFSNIIFDEHLYLVECEFRGKVKLTGTTFKESVNFSKSEFEERVSFEELSSKFINRDILQELSLTGTTFCKKADFTNVKFKKDVSFVLVKFQGETEFSNTEFSARSNFNDARFDSDVYFHGTIFNRTASFESIEFNGVSWFEDMHFNSMAWFCDCQFSELAFFANAVFEKNVDFEGVTFRKDAVFSYATFHGHANFDKVRFNRAIDFQAVSSLGAYSISNGIFFYKVPDFTQAYFKEAPRLDNAIVISPPSLRPFTTHIRELLKANNSKYKQLRRTLHRSLIAQQYLSDKKQHWIMEFFNLRRDEDEEARYRSLKRLAIQAHDHVNELEFSAGEVRARRYIRDYPWPWQNGLSSTFRYWTGALYDLTSDFGRSLWRPAFLWTIVFCLFSSLYLSNARVSAMNDCSLKIDDDMTPRYAANTIAAKNSLLFLGMDRTDKLKRAYACLYGASPLYAKASETLSDPRQKTGYDKLPNTQKHLAPNVPPLVSFLGILHSVLSLSLIFLLLLAIRNQFKIK